MTLFRVSKGYGSIILFNYYPNTDTMAYGYYEDIGHHGEISTRVVDELKFLPGMPIGGHIEKLIRGIGVQVKCSPELLGEEGRKRLLRHLGELVEVEGLEAIPGSQFCFTKSGKLEPYPLEEIEELKQV